jgi:hypothetical protein
MKDAAGSALEVAKRATIGPVRDRPSRDELTRNGLLAALMPAWAAAGLVDYCWHRVTKIEETSGPVESLLHLVMAAEGGVALVCGVAFELDSGPIAVAFAAALLHELTGIYDVAFAKTRRRLPQLEQHTHSFLEVLPFAIAGFMAFMHPESVATLLGAGRSGRPRLRFRLRPLKHQKRTIATIAAGTAFGVLPYVEELIRCLRAGSSGRGESEHVRS